MDLISSIFANVVSNFVFWILLGGAFILGLKVSQRRMRRFFGIANGQTLHVCLSNLWNPIARPPSVPGTIRSYIGLNELEASRAIDTLFGKANFRLPDLVRGLVDSLWARNAKVVETTVSPPINMHGSNYDYLRQPLIVIGGSRWNVVRRFYLAQAELKLQFSTEDEPDLPPNPGTFRVQILRGIDNQDDIPSRLALAILERKRMESGNVVFFCAGARGDITRETVKYLVGNWRQLYKDYDADDFALCLGFPDAEDGYLSSDVEPIVLRSSPRSRR